MTKKLKILAAGDIHGDKKLAEDLASLAKRESVDLVILNGDLVDDKNTEGIIGPFKKKNKKVIIIPGNHEAISTTDFLAELYDVTNLHAYSIKYKDVGFFGCGGANIGITKLSDDDIFNTLKKGYENVKGMRKKVMVTHIHPSGSLMEQFSNFVIGSKGLKKAIDIFQPDILICGHVHEAEGIEEKVGKTRVINVGRRGKIIDL